MNIAEVIDAMPRLQEQLGYLESLGFKREASSVCAAPGVVRWKNGDILLECRDADDWNATTTTVGILVSEKSPKDALRNLINSLHEYSVGQRMKFEEQMRLIESGIEQIGKMLGFPCGEEEKRPQKDGSECEAKRGKEAVSEEWMDDRPEGGSNEPLKF